MLLTLLLIQTSLLIGLILGLGGRYITEQLAKILDRLAQIERKPPSGVVRTEIAKGAQLVQHSDKSGVVKTKSPKEVAADNEREFNKRYGI